MLTRIQAPDGTEVGWHLVIDKDIDAESVDTLFLARFGWVRRIGKSNNARVAISEFYGEERDTYMLNLFDAYDVVFDGIVRMIERGTYTHDRARAILMEHSEGMPQYHHTSHDCGLREGCETCAQIDAEIDAMEDDE